MKALIDIGSNSIKGFIYEEDAEGFRYVWSRHLYTRLYSFIDENGLRSEGIEALVRDVSILINLIRAQGCAVIQLFATAGLRDSVNHDEVLDILEKRCGLRADLISSEEEAYCDMTSMRYFSGIDKALGMDMGGGSAQFFLYENDDIKKIMSLPLGALKIKEMFVEGDIPTPPEEEAIRDHVLTVLSAFGEHDSEIICAMGGSIVETAKLTGKTQFPMELSFEELRQLKRSLQQRDDLLSYLKEVCPGREYVMMPAMISYLAIGEYFSAKKLVALINGVREGYYIRHMMEK